MRSGNEMQLRDFIRAGNSVVNNFATLDYTNQFMQFLFLCRIKNASAACLIAHVILGVTSKIRRCYLYQIRR